jgi:hypothetical protein
MFGWMWAVCFSLQEMIKQLSETLDPGEVRADSSFGRLRSPLPAKSSVTKRACATAGISCRGQQASLFRIVSVTKPISEG